MPLHIPVENFKFYHDWTQAPLGSILQGTDAAGAITGIRCHSEEQGVQHPILYTAEENGHGRFLRQNEIDTGAIDVSEILEMTVIEPIIQSIEPAHYQLTGILLSIGDGSLYGKGRMGQYMGYARLDRGASAAVKYAVTFDPLQGARLAGTLGFRPKQK